MGSGNNPYLDGIDFSQIIENSHDAVSISIGGEIVYVNAAFSEISGYSVEETIGKNNDDFNPEEYREKIREISAKRQKGETVPDVYRSKLLRKDGKIIDVEYNVKLIKINGKNASLAYVSNLTERLYYERRLETALIHSKRLEEAKSVDEIFQVSLDIIVNQFGYDHVAIALVDGDSLAFNYGNGLGNVWQPFKIPLDGKGITVQAVKTKQSQLVHDTRNNHDFFSGIISTDSPFLSELDVPILLHNEVYAILNIESVITNKFSEEDRKIIELFAANIGGSIERLNLREEYINNSHLLNALTNNLPIITRHINQEGIITEHKGKLLDMIGMKQGQAVGLNFFEVYPAYNDEIRRALDGEMVMFEHRFVRNGKKLAWLNYLIPANTVHGVISFAMDITELRNAQDELLKNERLSAIGRISSIVGHELRNPLGVINNSRYYLGLKLKDADPKILRHLDLIQREVDRSNVIISDLLDFARGPKPPNISKSDFNSIITSAVQRVVVPSRIELVFEAGEIPVTLLDSDMILRVFINLISNAVDAIEDKGVITIKSRIEGDQIVASVQDTGAGITSDSMVSLFQPLFTTKTKGVGLGLYNSKSLIEAHQGTINVESEPNAGSVFTISLPLKEAL